MILNLCIPNVDIKYKYEYIHNIMTKINIGKVEQLKVLLSHTNVNCKKVFVKINISEKITKEQRHLLERLEQGKNIKILYEEPYFWKMVQCNY